MICENAAAAVNAAGASKTVLCPARAVAGRVADNIDRWLRGNVPDNVDGDWLIGIAASTSIDGQLLLQAVAAATSARPELLGNTVLRYRTLPRASASRSTCTVFCFTQDGGFAAKTLHNSADLLFIAQK